MSKRVVPPRSWEIDDLLDLGKSTGVTHLKAIPVLILEKWIRGGREEKVANYVRTKELARTLVNSGVVPPFKPKGTSTLLASLTVIQKSRNLTRPPLIEYKGNGIFWINLPSYEHLLHEYRKKFRENSPEEYEKLFAGNEPRWESKGQSTFSKTPKDVEFQDDIKQLIKPIEQALRDQQQKLKALEDEKQKLQAKIVTLQNSLHQMQEIPQRRIVDEELRSDCAELLENKKYYIDAIRRASVVLEERLKKAVGETGSENINYGASLVRYALAKDTGKLVISEVPNEQDGVFQLFSGAFAFVRNPPAHKKVKYTEIEAWQTINLIDYLLLLLGQAKPSKS